MGLSASEISALLDKEVSSATIHQRRVDFYDRFDKAAVFLLDWEYSNLFESIRLMDDPATGWYFRCKGCGLIVTRVKRVSHHTEHKREYERIRES